MDHLKLLAKACETIGYPDPSPPKKSSHHNHHHHSKTNGHKHSSAGMGLNNANGKSPSAIKKDSTASSTTTNGHQHQPARNGKSPKQCEPSTSSPAAVVGTAAQLPTPMPRANGTAFPTMANPLLAQFVGMFPPGFQFPMAPPLHPHQQAMMNNRSGFSSPLQHQQQMMALNALAGGGFMPFQHQQQQMGAGLPASYFAAMAAAAAAGAAAGMDPHPSSNGPLEQPQQPQQQPMASTPPATSAQSASVPVSGTMMISPRPASQNSIRKSSSAPQPVVGIPAPKPLIPEPHQQAQMDFAMFLHQQKQQMAATAAAAAEAAAMFTPNNSGGGDTTHFQPHQPQQQQPSIQSLLMAAACGLQKSAVRMFELPASPKGTTAQRQAEPSICGKSFASDAELISHYKQAHILIPSEAQRANGGGGGGKMKAVPAAKQRGSPPAPPQKQSPASLYGWSNMANGSNGTPTSTGTATLIPSTLPLPNNGSPTIGRFHPYMVHQHQQQLKLSPPTPLAQQQQQLALLQQFTAAQFEMAAAAFGGLVPPPPHQMMSAGVGQVQQQQQSPPQQNRTPTTAEEKGGPMESSIAA